MNNVITSGPVLPFAGTDENWFPVRITSVLGPTTYTFQEVWLTDAGLSIADRLGGNSNTSTDPAYPIDGSTFSVTAAGTAVQCLARRAPGLGGVGWELKGFSTIVSGSSVLASDYILTNVFSDTGLSLNFNSIGSGMFVVSFGVGYSFTGAVPLATVVNVGLVNGGGFVLDPPVVECPAGLTPAGTTGQISRAYFFNGSTPNTLTLFASKNPAVAAATLLGGTGTGTITTAMYYAKVGN